jgi:hypothetical protein
MRNENFLDIGAGADDIRGNEDVPQTDGIR